MTKEEARSAVMGAISMALKDPTLQQGFEIICKENAELKEQNIKDCKNFNKTMKETKEQWNKEHYQLAKARKHLKDLVYVVELGKNELAIVRILAEVKEFLKEE